MDVLSGGEGLQEGWVSGQVGQDAEFDLGIVCREEPPAWRGDEGLADSPSLYGADGDVLEVGVAARQPSRRRAGLVVGGVDPSRPGMNQERQGVDVGGFQLG
jgi:hypothetical protein